MKPMMPPSGAAHLVKLFAALAGDLGALRLEVEKLREAVDAQPRFKPEERTK